MVGCAATQGQAVTTCTRRSVLMTIVVAASQVRGVPDMIVAPQLNKLICDVGRPPGKPK